MTLDFYIISFGGGQTEYKKLGVLLSKVGVVGLTSSPEVVDTKIGRSVRARLLLIPPVVTVSPSTGPLFNMKEKSIGLADLPGVLEGSDPLATGGAAQVSRLLLSGGEISRME